MPELLFLELVGAEERVDLVILSVAKNLRSWTFNERQRCFVTHGSSG